jgi:hypothetical protein
LNTNLFVDRRILLNWKWQIHSSRLHNLQAKINLAELARLARLAYIYADDVILLAENQDIDITTLPYHITTSPLKTNLEASIWGDTPRFSTWI